MAGLALSQAISEARAQIAPLISFMAANALDRARRKPPPSARKTSEESSGRFVDASGAMQSRRKVAKTVVIEAVGVEFVAENGGGAGAKLRRVGK